MKRFRNLCIVALLVVSTVACAQSRSLGNEEVTMANGAIEHLQDLLNKSGYTLIDCWASWCGPCRRAIPQIKAISQKYANRLSVVSISCDQSESDWRRAMDEENMTWPQAILIDAQRVFMNHYDISAIPCLMLVRDGKILLSTYSSEEIVAYLEANK